MGVEYTPPFEHSALSSPLASPAHDYVTAEATVLVGVLVVFYLTVILLLFGSNLACPRSLFPTPPVSSKGGCAARGDGTENSCETCLHIDDSGREGDTQKDENDFNENALKSSLKVYRGARSAGSKYDYCSIDVDEDFEDRTHVETCKLCLKDANDSDEFVDTDESDDEDDYSIDDTLVIDRKGEYSLSYSKKQCNDEEEINWNGRIDKRPRTGFDSRRCPCEEQRYESLRGQLDFKRYQKLYHIENQETIAIRQEKLRNIEQQLRAQSKPVDGRSSEAHRSGDDIGECVCEFTGPNLKSCASHLRGKPGVPFAAMRATEVNEALALVHYPHNRANYTAPHARACKCSTVIPSDTYIGRADGWQNKRDGRYAKGDFGCQMCQEFCRTCSDAGHGNDFKRCSNLRTAAQVFNNGCQEDNGPRRSVTSSSLNRWASSYESPPGHSMQLGAGYDTRKDLKTSTSDSFLSSHARSCKVCTALSSTEIRASDRRPQGEKLEPEKSLKSFQGQTRTPNYFASKFMRFDPGFSSARETCDYSDSEKTPETIGGITYDEKRDSEPRSEEISSAGSEIGDAIDGGSTSNFKKNVTETASTFPQVLQEKQKEENKVERPSEVEDDNDQIKEETALTKSDEEIDRKTEKLRDTSESLTKESAQPTAKATVNVKAAAGRAASGNSIGLEVILLEEKSGHVATHVASQSSV